MKNKKMRNLFVSALVLTLTIPLIYKNNVQANTDKTLDEMIDDYFVVIDDDGNTEIIPFEKVASEEGEEISVAEKYDVVSHIGGDEEIVETVDSKKEAEMLADSLESENSTIDYSIQPFSTRAITVGVVYIKTSGVTEYTNAKTGESGYTNGGYGLDAAYIGTFNGKIRGKFAGVVADFSPSDVNVVSYGENSDVSYYMVEDGYLRHYYYYGSNHSLASTRVGYALSYLQKDKKYYSYDGHYFYEDYATMIKDYQMDQYDHAVNPKNPYYNYYQYLSHRALSSYTGDDFNQMAIDHMGKTSYVSSKFNNIGDAFVDNQNAYTVNSMLMFGVAANESNWGRSSIARDKNNLFGHGANDSNPYWDANGYSSPEKSVYDHAYYFVSRGYMDYNDWRYYGPHLGDKEGGLNVKYASDPYWGEKAACRTYFLDTQPEDYGSAKIGIIDGLLKNYPLYKEPSTSSTIVYKCNNLLNLPVLIVDTIEQNGKKWYKIQSDTSLVSDRTKPDYSLVYNASHDYLYIPADGVSVIYDGVGTTPNNPTESHRFKIENTNLITEPLTTVGDVISQYSSAVIKKGGTTLTNPSDLIGTDYTVTIDGNSYTVIKMGDVNGDGKVNSGDTLVIKQHIMSIRTITNASYLKAADINSDGKINSGDSLIAKQQIVGLKNITIE